jgi:hypothetical protein
MAPTLKRIVLSDMCFPFEGELRQTVHTLEKHSVFERLAAPLVAHRLCTREM